MAELTHLPARPGWDCTGDHDSDTPWPCDEARVALAETTDRVSLTTYMAERWTEATADLGTVTAAELYERFLAWPRQAAAR